MAFSDPGGQNRKIIWYDMPLQLTLAGTVYPGDMVGYSAGWVQADADGGIKAQFVAVEQGDSADKITVAKRALVDGYTDGTADDQLYLSDTAGSVSVTTSGQKVGKVLASGLAVIEPEAYIDGGTWAAPVESRAAGKTFRELWAKCSGAGHTYGEYVNVQVSSQTAGTGNAVRAEFNVRNASGHGAGGGAGIHASSYLDAGPDGVAGILSGLSGTITIAAETRTVQGTYAPLVLQSEVKTGNTMPATSAFIFAQDAGAVKLPSFIYWNQAGADNSAFEAKTAGSNGAMTMVVNVNGTLWYVPMSASRS